MNIIVDFILSISVVADAANDISLGLSGIPEVSLEQVFSIVCLLEILVIHFEGHLSHGLPGREPSGDVVHLVVDTHPGVVDGANSDIISGKSTIGVIAPISHGSIVEAPDLVVGTRLSGQVVGQHEVIFKLDHLFRCARVYAVLDKRDVVSNRGVSKVDLSRE